MMEHTESQFMMEEAMRNAGFGVQFPILTVFIRPQNLWPRSVGVALDKKRKKKTKRFRDVRGGSNANTSTRPLLCPVLFIAQALYHITEMTLQNKTCNL